MVLDIPKAVRHFIEAYHVDIDLDGLTLEDQIVSIIKRRDPEEKKILKRSLKDVLERYPNDRDIFMIWEENNDGWYIRDPDEIRKLFQLAIDICDKDLKEHFHPDNYKRPSR